MGIIYYLLPSFRSIDGILTFIILLCLGDYNVSATNNKYFLTISTNNLTCIKLKKNCIMNISQWFYEKFAELVGTKRNNSNYY